MADAQENQEEEKPKKSGMSTMTLIGVIGGVVVLQVIIVFVVFKVFVSPGVGSSHNTQGERKPETSEEVSDEDNTEENAVKVREVREVIGTEDLILNPRGSSSRYVMLALGLEVDTPEVVKTVEEKLMIPIRDKTSSIISSYSIEDLQRNTLRDSLRVILRKELQPFFGEEKLRSVYFSKFIIQ